MKSIVLLSFLVAVLFVGTSALFSKNKNHKSFSYNSMSSASLFDQAKPTAASPAKVIKEGWLKLSSMLTLVHQNFPSLINLLLFFF